MEELFGQTARVATLFPAVFFALQVVSGVLNLYLRFHDHLRIDREDVQTVMRNSGYSLLFLGLAWSFSSLPFFTTISLILCVFVLVLVIRLNSVIQRMKRPG